MRRSEFGETVVELNGVRKVYEIRGRTEPLVALDDVTVGGIRRGEFVMILGPSGGGKTTLLNLIGTIDRPTAGRLVILGSEIKPTSSDEFLARLRLEKIGFVFQTFNLIATMSAYENVCLPMTILGRLSAAEIDARAKELLSMVGLRDRMGHLPSELSGGEQQRVTIARALTNQPEMLLLDEPTGDLDTVNTIEVMRILIEINQSRKMTCVLVTHNPDLEIYADRIIYMKDGRVDSVVINSEQSQLSLDDYLAYVNSTQK